MTFLLDRRVGVGVVGIDASFVVVAVGGIDGSIDVGVLLLKIVVVNVICLS